MGREGSCSSRSTRMLSLICFACLLTTGMVRVPSRVIAADNQDDLWDDTKITPGSDWAAAIDKALVKARVAVLLVSPDYAA